MAVLFLCDDLRRRPLRKPADRKWERGGRRLWSCRGIVKQNHRTKKVGELPQGDDASLSGRAAALAATLRAPALSRIWKDPATGSGAREMPAKILAEHGSPCYIHMRGASGVEVRLVDLRLLV